jgi:hypothetical protein
MSVMAAEVVSAARPGAVIPSLNAKRGDPPEFVAEPPNSRAGFLNAQPRGT